MSPQQALMSQAMDPSRTRHAEIEAELTRVKKKKRRKPRRQQNRQVMVPAALWRGAIVIFALTHPAVEPAGTV